MSNYIKAMEVDNEPICEVVEPMVFRGESEKTEIEKWKMFVEFVEEVINDES
jgi:hypothetical protein